jgi:hypothetical protein
MMMIRLPGPGRLHATRGTAGCRDPRWQRVMAGQAGRLGTTRSLLAAAGPRVTAAGCAGDAEAMCHIMHLKAPLTADQLRLLAMGCLEELLDLGAVIRTSSEKVIVCFQSSQQVTVDPNSQLVIVLVTVILNYAIRGSDLP